MATTLQEILERYEHEHASTHAVIAAMPDAHSSFLPRERSLDWAQLAWHECAQNLWDAGGLARGRRAHPVIHGLWSHSIELAVSGFDGSFGVTSTHYDVLGRAISLTAPLPQGTTTSEYDSLDRLVRTTLPDKTTHTYLHFFASTRAVDPEGLEEQTHYDLDGGVSHTADRWVRPGMPTVDITTTFTSAPFDLVSTVTDHKGHLTSMQYDVRGRRTQLNDPNRGTTKTTYYGTGEIATETHLANGHTITFGYDDLGR